LTPEEMHRVRVPTLFLHAEKDALYTPEITEKLLAAMEARQKELQQHDKQESVLKWKVFPGQTHGFALRGNPEDESVVRAAKEAFDDSLAWFKTHL